jgi:lipid-binding SYLF domain-containing protein
MRAAPVNAAAGGTFFLDGESIRLIRIVILKLQARTIMLNARAILFLAAALVAPASHAATAAEVDQGVDQTLHRFTEEIGSGKAMLGLAKGELVFPKIYKAGIGIGGQYGEGALRVGGRTVAYYNDVGGSFGFQLGAQAQSVVILFLDEKALEKFRHSHGWKVGVDGSIALVDVGIGQSIDTNSIKEPVIGFIFGQQGLMYNLSLEGSKFTKIDLN